MGPKRKLIRYFVIRVHLENSDYTNEPHAENRACCFFINLINASANKCVCDNILYCLLPRWNNASFSLTKVARLVNLSYCTKWLSLYLNQNPLCRFMFSLYFDYLKYDILLQFLIFEKKVVDGNFVFGDATSGSVPGVGQGIQN